MCMASIGSMASASGSSGSMLGGMAQLAPSLLSAVSGSVGSANNAAAQGALLQYQQQNALTNAQIANAKAADTIQQGELQASQVGQRARQMLGAQRAAIAANGVQLNSGSAANIQASTQYMRGVDEATVRNNAARAAWGQQVTAGNYTDRADALGAAAGAQSPFASGLASFLSGGGRAGATAGTGVDGVGSGSTSLLGGAQGIAGSWYNIYKNGGFGGSADTTFNNPSDYG